MPPEQLIGAKAHEILPLDVADQLVGGIQRAIDTGEVVTGEYTLELGGVPRDFEARIVKAGDEAVLIGREFTERNRAQAELTRLHAELQQRHRDLEHERDFIRTVVDTAPSLMCLTTPGGYIIRFNTSLEQLSGRRDGDLIRGNAFWDVFIAPEERETVRRAMENVGAQGGHVELESTWITAAGDRRQVAWSTTPLRDDKGHPRLLVSGTDITERKLHEDELRRSRARLVEASDAERRRLERNLHDGAQQRLVSLSLMLRLAQARVEDDPEQADRLLGQAVGRAFAGSRRAPRARARDPPSRALGPWARRRARGASLPHSASRRARGSGRPPAGAGRGGRILRRLRGARERGQVRRGILGRR